MRNFFVCFSYLFILITKLVKQLQMIKKRSYNGEDKKNR